MSETSENTDTIPDEITMQLAKFLRHGLGNNFNQQPTVKSVDIGLKLTGSNYQLWIILMKNELVGQGLVSHVTGVPKPPAESDPAYTRWEQVDSKVFSLILKNIDQSLSNGVSQYPTTKELWEGLTTMFGSGSESLQVFDLHRRANRMVQGELTVEEMWYKFQEIWMSIDRRQPNPMTCSKDIETHNKIGQETRLYQFLLALDQKYEVTKKEILKMEPLPSVARAYALILQDNDTGEVLRPTEGSNNNNGGIGAGLATRDRACPVPSPNHGHNPNQGQMAHNRRNWGRRNEKDKSRLTCSHCGGKRHTKEGCFHLIGFPDWWEEFKRSKSNNRRATAAVRSEKAADATRTVAGNQNTGHGDGNRGDRAEVREEAAAPALAARASKNEGRNKGEDDS